MKYSYFPGCSLHSTAREYDESTRAVCEALGIELVELPDWNCCGATSAHSLNDKLGIAIPARNMKIAEGVGLDLVVPCAACFNRTKHVDYLIRENGPRRKEMEELLGFTFSSNIKALHLLDLIIDEVGLDEVRQKVVRPLSELNVVPYYGCLLVRPPKVTEFDDLENPTSLDKVLGAVGARSLEWSFKTECCGASLSLTKKEIVQGLVSRLIDAAKEAGADGIVTACPLCQANLEMRQQEGFPVFYFTELLGIAFGLKEARTWLDRHLVSVTI